MGLGILLRMPARCGGNCGFFVYGSRRYAQSFTNKYCRLEK
jgi:hypothetical protein